MKSKSLDFCNFIKNSPCPFHASDEIAKRLEEKGFSRLDTSQVWQLKPENQYFTVIDQCLVIAFKTPKNPPKKATILATHIDSPCLKLKPHPVTIVQSIGILNTEIYGSPLLHSWLDRECKIVGKVFIEDSQKQIKSKTIELPFSVLINNLAIHLDRSIADKGVLIHRQDHLKPVFSINAKEGDFEKALQASVAGDKILSFDLFLVPKQEPSFFGMNEDLLASYRIDNLSSAYAALQAFIEPSQSVDCLQMSIFWDHEEIGSMSAKGADSNICQFLLQRILNNLGVSLEEAFALYSRSLCYSIDVAHGYHPNFSEKFDPQNAPFLGKGVVVKFNANQKYATNGANSAIVLHMAGKIGMNIQQFAARSDIPSGSTVGSMMAAMTGISTIDLGIACWAMHSARETICLQDLQDLTKLLTHALQDS